MEHVIRQYMENNEVRSLEKCIEYVMPRFLYLTEENTRAINYFTKIINNRDISIDSSILIEYGILQESYTITQLIKDYELLENIDYVCLFNKYYFNSKIFFLLLIRNQKYATYVFYLLKLVTYYDNILTEK
jgi:hypothetical protein